MSRCHHTLARLAALCTACFAPAVFAHAETGVANGLASGFLHPIHGTDHLVAMIAVGLWGALLGAPAIWVLPIAFPMVMALGAVLAILGLPLPFVEVGVSASALLLGLAVAAAWRPAVVPAAVVVALFGMFHGYAHGTEIPHAVNPLSYGIGFVVATGLLHLAGIVIGLLVHVPRGALAVRACGGLVAAVGVYFLAGSLGGV